MKMGKYAALAGLMLATTLGHAAEAPPIPEQPDLKRYESIPAPWRDYLLQARTAERIADPLQRCLAFPDLPGNQWPEGHAEAHCRSHFADEPLTVARIGEMLDRGETKQLETMLDTRLQRHFSADDFSEIIHDDLKFDLDDAGNARHVAEKWIELAPQSAYANLAFANVLRFSAWEARGGEVAAKTPKENMRRMSELAQQALSHFRKAIDLEPKLMPAYEGLINLAKLDSLDEVGEQALKSAGKLDPTCSQVIFEHMGSLDPSWGGSYEQQLAYANSISRHITKRPQLAVYLGNPYEDLGSIRVRDEEFTVETLQILEAAIFLGSGEWALHNAAIVVGKLTDAKPDMWKRLAYLLQESRFREIDHWGMRETAIHLIHMSEPAWSLKYSLRANDLEPNDLSGRHNTAIAYMDMGRIDDAEREFRIVIAGSDRQLRHDALRWVAEFRLLGGDMQSPEIRKANVAKAEPFIDQFTREYPGDVSGRILTFYRGVALERVGPASLAEVRSLLKQMDRNDSWQAFHATRLEAMLKELEAMF